VKLLSVILILGVIELFLYMLVHYMRKDFQWLITKEDEEPWLDKKGLDSFFAKSHDPVLGWTRRKNTEGVEKGETGEVRYHIDELGSRLNQNCDIHPPTIACFGDSYAFCRQVEDTETWEHHLSELLETCALNFGVGNYGLDQALLRYKQTKLPNSIDTVIMAFVPETICRIQSTWKHYLEFGNTFAFKPRYVLNSDGELELITNPMQDREDFDNYRIKLDQIIENDRFYRDKFRKYQFRFPFIMSFLRNLKRNSSLIGRLLRREYHRMEGNIDPHIEDAPFEYIMNDNIRIAHQLYQDEQSVALFTSLIKSFIGLAETRNHKAYVVILPQLIDLRIMAKNNGSTFSDVLSTLDIPEGILHDFTPYFAEFRDIEKLFINDKYGGHIANLGNKYIAEKLSQLITQ